MRRRLAKVAAVVAALVAVLSVPLAVGLGNAFSTTVIEVRELHPPEVVDVFRHDYRRQIEAGELTALQAAEIYGTVTDRQPVKVLFVDESRLFVPPERPDIALLVVERSANEDPWTPGRLRLVAWFASLCAASLSLLLALGLWLGGRGRSRASEPRRRTAHG